MDNRNSVFAIFIFTALFVSGNSLYERKFKKQFNLSGQCTKNNPIAQPNTDVNEISGKLWHGIKQLNPNPSDVFVRDFVNATDVTTRWFFSLHTSISTQRLGKDPGYCESITLPIKKIRGRNAYNIFSSTTEAEAEYRIIYFSREYLIIWVCFEFDKKSNCLNSALRLYRDRPDFNIGHADIHRLDRVMYRATCGQIGYRDFTTTFTNRRACPDLMLPGKGSLCY